MQINLFPLEANWAAELKKMGPNLNLMAPTITITFQICKILGPFGYKIAKTFYGRSITHKDEHCIKI